METNHPDDKRQHPCKSLLVHFLLTEQFLLCKSGGGGVAHNRGENIPVQELGGQGGGGIIFEGDLFSGNMVYTACINCLCGSRPLQ